MTGFKSALLALAAFAATSASASVYECRNQEFSYLAALDTANGGFPGTGLFYTKERGSYANRAGDLTHSFDANSASIQFRPLQMDVDWRRPANRTRCFVMGEPTVSLTIRGRGQASEVRFLPVVIRNPHWRGECAIPRPMVRPLAISCRAL